MVFCFFLSDIRLISDVKIGLGQLTSYSSLEARNQAGFL